MHEHEKALELYQKAADRQPDNQYVWYYMGLTYNDMKQYELQVLEAEDFFSFDTKIPGFISFNLSENINLIILAGPLV